MAVEGEIKFGLNVNRNLADIVNADDALANIGLNVADLDIIRGAAGTLSITADDIRAVGGLNVEIETYITKLYNDTQQYSAIIDQTAGTTETLKGNLVINGLLGASSIKYKYIDPDNTTLKVADISTSRVSSWSSTDNPATDVSPIFYGGQIDVDGKVDTPAIEFLEPAEAVRFRDSEVATHIIEAQFDGQTVYLYAMKGIPLVFDGFFRDLTSRVELTSAKAVSWIVTNETASYLTREYENVGGSSTTVSELRFRDTRAAPRKVKIFVNPNIIKTLPLNGAGIQSLPAATLESLTNLQLTRNIIKNFPDFKQFAPIVSRLDIRENNFTLGEDVNLRKFNNQVLERMPSTVTNLLMGNTFNGSVTAQMRPGSDNMPSTEAANLVIGNAYEVTTVGTTDFNIAFGTSGLTYNVGDTGFAVSATVGSGVAQQLINEQQIKKFRTYEILDPGSTDLSLVGATSTNIGDTFEATANGADIYDPSSPGAAKLKDNTVGLPLLLEMNLNSHSRGGARNYFDRDSDDPTGATPAVPAVCQSYQMYRNSFDSIGDGVKELPNLTSINLYSNGIYDNTFFLASDQLDYVNIGGNPGINVPNLSGKTTINNFYSHYNRAGSLGDDRGAFVTPAGSYKFSNCTGLDRLYIYASGYNGPIQKFAGNTQLNYVEGRYTALNGGKAIAATAMEDGKEYSIFYNPDAADFTLVGAPQNNLGTVFTADLSVNTITNLNAKVIDREYVLHPDIFDDTPGMGTFRISSSGLLNKPMHPEVFSKTPNMYGIEVRSFNRGVNGNLPLLNNMTNLRYLVVLQNNLTGPIPNFANNPRCYYAHMYGNAFNGNCPNIESNSMAYCYFHVNQLSGFTGMSTPNLRRLFLSYNQITSVIPDMNNLTRMYDFYINNNQLSGYTEGALTGARSLYRFDISNNPTLTTGAINTLIADMVANYENNPRGNVNLNIRNTATPTGDAVEQIEFLRSVGWNIRT